MNMKQTFFALQKKLGFSASFVLTMGVTIGVFLAVAVLYYVTLLQPLSYQKQTNLFVLESKIQGHPRAPKVSMYPYPVVTDIYKHQTHLDSVAIVTYGDDILFSLPSKPTVNLAFATPEYFQLLDVEYELGTGLSSENTLESSTPEAVISYQLWQDKFNSNPDILGEKVMLDSVSYTIIGVTSEDFIEPQLYEVGLKTDVFLPWPFNSVPERARNSWSNFAPNLFVLSYKSNDSPVSFIESQLTSQVNERWKQEVIGRKSFEGMSLKMELKPLKDVVIGDGRDIYFVMLLGGIGLLLIASTNVLNLLISRLSEQSRSLAIRAALGANKWHLVKHLYSEVFTLMFASLVVSLLVASLLFSVIRGEMQLVFPRAQEVSVNGFTILIASLTAFILSILLTLLPSLSINYKKLKSVVQGSGKGSGIQVSAKARKFALIFEVFIASVISIFSIMYLWSALAVINAPTHFKIDDVTQVQLTYSSGDGITEEEFTSVIEQIQGELLSMAEVESVSNSSSPFNGFSGRSVTKVVNDERFTVRSKYIDDEYFTIIDQQLSAGRTFSATEVKEGALVAVINESFSESFGGPNSAINSLISMRDEQYQIVGVVKDIHLPKVEGQEFRIYRPAPEKNSNFIVQLKPGMTLEPQSILNLIDRVNPRFTLYKMTELKSLYNQATFFEIVTVVISTLLLVVILFLCAVGLYGVISYGVNLRSVEIGTKLAIGSSRLKMKLAIVKENSIHFAIGFLSSALIIGYLIWKQHITEFVVSVFISSFVVSSAALLAVVVCASYLPINNLLRKNILQIIKGE
ncbi:ABC transporter permease [Pseudoalteromonas umbrosa]|uniref:ABC transporter permease n=1 Tax=Pseudoalteromonas umbrosa TaxID=3048489 RepID=UPI0024C3DF9E|nr:ABC transporter permease [Pseudoalteromonas sp. B95]MDK1286999.1 ABC transporter permease [Pseudoalteromonas sp. B95]